MPLHSDDDDDISVLFIITQGTFGRTEVEAS